VSDPRLAAIDRIYVETIRLHEATRRGSQAGVLRAVDLLAAAFRDGRRVLVFGNGGSASDAQHFAAEFVGRFQRERRAAGAIALTTDTSILTAVGNDYAFEQVFARQIEALGESGDVAIGITTSGASKNVIEALAVARQRGLTIIAVTGGDGGAAGKLADVHLNVADRSAARVQEVHRTLLHVICELVEETL
jgi:D-sedoheptulose 7-phosphate isomerase